MSEQYEPKYIISGNRWAWGINSEEAIAWKWLGGTALLFGLIGVGIGLFVVGLGVLKEVSIYTMVLKSALIVFTIVLLALVIGINVTYRVLIPIVLALIHQKHLE